MTSPVEPKPPSLSPCGRLSFPPGMTPARLVAMVATAALLGACGRGTVPEVGDANGGRTGAARAGITTIVPGHDSTSARNCTSHAGGGHGALMVDWIDFVRLHGIEYVAAFDGLTPEVTVGQLGSVVGRVQCQLNALTYTRDPGPARDGDAAFLPIGTAVHAVRGYSSSCRVAARIGGAYRVYVAHWGVDTVSAPTHCATGSPRAR